jgi:nitronate monooxygenase
MSGILQQRLNLELPIIQAPMAGVQGSALAIAVSNAGGLGTLPCAMLNPAQIRSELEIITGKCNKPLNRPFNVNFFCHQPRAFDAAREKLWRDELSPFYREYDIDEADIAPAQGRTPFNKAALELLQEFKPAVVSFHFGLPAADLLDAVKATGAMTLCSATTLAEALWLEQHGIDAVIAQGVEAGGHRGMFLSEDISEQVGTFALLPQIVNAVNLPVIAAGGIADAAGVSAALSLGADAVQIGTAYLLCDEAETSALHRTALQSPAAVHTALTNRFTGRPARSIVNRVMRELGPMGEVSPFPLAGAALAPLRAAAEASDSSDFSSLWAGQNTSGCRQIGAAEMTRELASSLR